MKGIRISTLLLLIVIIAQSLALFQQQRAMNRQQAEAAVSRAILQQQMSSMAVSRNQLANLATQYQAQLNAMKSQVSDRKTEPPTK